MVSVLDSFLGLMHGEAVLTSERGKEIMEVMEMSRMAGVLVDMLRHSGYQTRDIAAIAQLMEAHLAAEEEHAEHALPAAEPPMN